MSAFHSNMLLGSVKTADLGDPIEQSLRVLGNASGTVGSFGRTPSTTTSSDWTASFWVKVADPGYGLLLFGNIETNPYSYLHLTADGNIQWEAGVTSSNSPGVYRDPSAWYHIVCTPSNGWVNGELSFNGTVLPYIDNNTTTFWIGAAGGTYQSSFNGSAYFAEFYFIDGQTLSPTDFGRYNDKGVWVPKTPTISSYGTNGFHLTFDPNQSNGIGHDSSGKNNHFTATGFTTTAGFNDDVVDDTPTSNRATLNAILSANNQTLSNANLTGGTTSTYISLATQIPDYSYYWESTGSNYYYGIAHVDTVRDNYLGSKSDQVGWFNNGAFYVNAASVGTFGPSFTTTDVVMQAYDPATGKYWVGKNGTWHGSGNPATGANPAYTVSAALRDKMIPASNVSAGTSSHNFGQQTFSYTVPTGFKALATENLSEPTIKDGNDHFRAITGTGATIVTTASTAFPSGLWWIKDRDNANQHQLVDSLRGTSAIHSPSIVAEQTYSAPTGNSVAWCWNYNSSNPGKNGFDIVTYTGNGQSNRGINHNLGKTPEFMIVKNRDEAYQITVYHSSEGPTKYAFLNTNAGFGTDSTIWSNTAPTATQFTVGNNILTNGDANGDDMIAYLWTSVPGYSAFGSYAGNSDADGPFIYTGFRPAFVLIKSTSGYNWTIVDSTRNPHNPVDTYLFPNQTLSDDTYSTYNLDFVSNGFKLRNSSATDTNYTGNTYIYAAFAENPFGGKNTAPATAR